MKILPLLASAFVWFLSFGVLGALSIIVGTYLLAGVAIALLVLGLMLMGASAFIRRGMTNG